MYRLFSPLFLLIGLMMTGSPVAAVQQEPPAKKATQPKKSQPKDAASLSGCVDEQNGQYVLIHDQTRDLIANLEADGFPTEAFAKHVGHKVTVRGTASPNGAHPVFKVRSVEPISDTCGPQEHVRE